MKNENRFNETKDYVMYVGQKAEKSFSERIKGRYDNSYFNALIPGTKETLYFEADAIIIGDKNVYLIEYKSWKGTGFDTDKDWTVIRPNGEMVQKRNCLYDTKIKAKFLKKYLSRYLTNGLVPWIHSLVVFDDVSNDIDLHDNSYVPIMKPLGSWEDGVIYEKELDDWICEKENEIHTPNPNIRNVGRYIDQLRKTDLVETDHNKYNCIIPKQYLRINGISGISSIHISEIYSIEYKNNRHTITKRNGDVITTLLTGDIRIRKSPSKEIEESISISKINKIQLFHNDQRIKKNDINNRVLRVYSSLHLDKMRA